MTRATGPKFNVHFRRRRDNLTDYKKRLSLLKSNVPRLVVRKTNLRMIVQMVKYDPKGDKVVSDVDSRELKKFGWGLSSPNIPTAYLCGYVCGVESMKAGVKEFVLDIGIARPTQGNVLFYAMKGAADAGLKTNFDESIIDPKRMSGAHIADYAKKLKANADAYNRQFSAYIKSGVVPETLPEQFEKAKAKIK